MIQQGIRFCVTTLVLSALAGGSADAQYRYGGSQNRGYAATDEQGVILFVEGGLYNPRNVDNVVAVELSDGGATFLPIIPEWDEDFGGRAGLGYQWATGNSLVVSYWGYEGEVDASGSSAPGDSLAFAIGPPVFDAGSGELVGDVGDPGFFAVRTEVRAETGDLTFARRHELADAFSMEWSAGARWARYEETHDGSYDEDGSPAGLDSFAADKRLEGEMFGVRLGARGAYRVGSVSLSSSLAFSMLDGELTGESSLTPNGSANSDLSPSRAVLEDDGRSGSIRDFDVRAAWHAPGDRVQVSLAWEQSRWEEIAADRLRAVSGAATALSPRDEVTFSGVKLGVKLRL